LSHDLYCGKSNSSYMFRLHKAASSDRICQKMLRHYDGCCVQPKHVAAIGFTITKFVCRWTAYRQMSNWKRVRQESGVMRIQIVALLVERDSLIEYLRSYFWVRNLNPVRSAVSSQFSVGSDGHWSIVGIFMEHFPQHCNQNQFLVWELCSSELLRASSSNFLPTFRDNLPILSSGFKNPIEFV
jgi:hypothetical protein